MFHLSVAWRVPCVLVTALGSRCHLEGPVTATVLTVRSWTAPGPEEALQPPTEGYTSSLANLAVGVQRRGLPGEPGKDRKDPAGPSLVQLPSLMGFRAGEVGGRSVSRPQGGSSGLARCLLCAAPGGTPSTQRRCRRLLFKSPRFERNFLRNCLSF